MKDEQSDPKRREPGYYWVKLPRYAGNEWIVACYMSRSWVVELHDEYFTDKEFSEIDERRIERPEGLE